MGCRAFDEKAGKRVWENFSDVRHRVGPIDDDRPIFIGRNRSDLYDLVSESPANGDLRRSAKRSRSDFLIRPSMAFSRSEKCITETRRTGGQTLASRVFAEVLTSKTDSTGTTTYEYDALGNLRKVTPPTGSVIEYVIDGANRRVGKKVGGTLTTRWIYSGTLRIVGEVDAGRSRVR